MKAYFLKPTLKVFISLRASSQNGSPWRNMIGTAASRAIFIESALHFMDTFAFDGMDLLLEDMGETQENGSNVYATNFVAFLEQLRSAMRGIKQISVATPASPCESYT